jgi:F-type H+-transporting ATPase subunit gamma
MAKLHTIRRRITSVNNIHQITKAMELVAASKLRRAQAAAVRSRLYARRTQEVLQHVVVPEEEGSSLYFTPRPVTHHTLVVFSGDRGLAGAYHLNLFKAVGGVLAEAAGQQVEAIVVGQKGAQFLHRLAGQVTVQAVYTDWGEPTAAEVRPIARAVLEAYRSGATDQVSIVYTDFVSVARQQPQQMTLLPLTQPAALVAGAVRDQVFEPSAAAVLDFLVPRVVELQLYQAALEAAASEHAARMLAMQQASENAEEVTDDLTLAYNGARQAVITQELAEISAGAEASV